MCGLLHWYADSFITRLMSFRPDAARGAFKRPRLLNLQVDSRPRVFIAHPRHGIAAAVKQRDSSFSPDIYGARLRVTLGCRLFVPRHLRRIVGATHGGQPGGARLRRDHDLRDFAAGGPRRIRELGAHPDLAAAVDGPRIA